MKIALAATWRPQGELPRLYRLLPKLAETYDALVIAIRPGKLMSNEKSRLAPKIDLFDIPAPGWGRYLSIQKAITYKPDYIHYADLDILLHWIERNPQEWLKIVGMIKSTDCLIIGRSEQAFLTRP